VHCVYEVRKKWSAGRMRPAGRNFSTPAVQSAVQSRLLHMAHIFAIGLTSGEFLGQSSIGIFLPVMKIFTIFDVWQRARSCWKIPEPLGYLFSSFGTTLLWITSIYCGERIIPFDWLKISGAVVTAGSLKHLFLRVLKPIYIYLGAQTESSLGMIFECADFSDPVQRNGCHRW